MMLYVVVGSVIFSALSYVSGQSSYPSGNAAQLAAQFAAQQKPGSQGSVPSGFPNMPSASSYPSTSNVGSSMPSLPSMPSYGGSSSSGGMSMQNLAAMRSMLGGRSGSSGSSAGLGGMMSQLFGGMGGMGGMAGMAMMGNNDLMQDMIRCPMYVQIYMPGQKADMRTCMLLINAGII